MAGGTIFFFVTDGIERPSSGPARRPASGTCDSAAAMAGWRCVEFAPSRSVTHVRLRRP